MALDGLWAEVVEASGEGLVEVSVHGRADEEIGAQLLQTLRFVHSRDVIHRDIKPANVILTTQWDGRVRPVLLDFGIARVRGQLRSEGRGATLVQRKMGTPGYMSPEQLRSAADVDVRSDIFSLGVLLLQMASGTPPFERASDIDTMAAVIKGDYTIPDALRAKDPGLCAAIDGALPIERGERWANCAAMLEALQIDSGGPPPPARAREPELAVENPPESPASAPGPSSARPSRAPAQHRSSLPPIFRPVGSFSLSLGKLGLAADGHIALSLAPDFEPALLIDTIRAALPVEMAEERSNPGAHFFEEVVFFFRSQLGRTGLVTTESICVDGRRILLKGIGIENRAGSSRLKLTGSGGSGAGRTISMDLGSVALALRFIEVIRLLASGAGGF